ncbi:hypothetical protein [Halococcoides cellulosivorans]|uniref:Uncharacterized protein n=1 Tax=Halococcoides cellulosivorans TaxID=1679096 RepID=A0A2R4X1L8_9EURY|nr:hypothetical protein [Halococcoides cellulosivorans]AWB27689.1 hypothetical protein HARCEL1_08180 [Halococcoides cellulosivorans]
MLIPGLGIVFNIATFPGIVANRVVQGVFEEYYGVPVHEFAVPEGVDVSDLEGKTALGDVARPLGATEEAGADERVERVVDYDALDSFGAMFGLVLGPVVVTTILALALYGISVGLEFGGIVTNEGSPWLWLAGFYPGFALAAHALPNDDPIQALWRQSKRSDSLLQIVGYPLVALSKLVSLLRIFWIDAIYAVVLYALLAMAVGVL